MSDDYYISISNKRYPENFDAFLNSTDEKERLYKIAERLFGVEAAPYIHHGDQCKIFDVGFGEGTLTKKIADLLSSYLREVLYHGIELEPKYVKQTSVLLNNSSVSSYFLREGSFLDKDKLALFDDDYDIILASHCAYYADVKSLVLSLIPKANNNGTLVFFHQSELSEITKLRSMYALHMSPSPTVEIRKTLESQGYKLLEILYPSYIDFGRAGLEVVDLDDVLQVYKKEGRNPKQEKFIKIMNLIEFVFHAPMEWLEVNNQLEEAIAVLKKKLIGQNLYLTFWDCLQIASKVTNANHTIAASIESDNIIQSRKNSINKETLSSDKLLIDPTSSLEIEMNRINLGNLSPLETACFEGNERVFDHLGKHLLNSENTNKNFKGLIYASMNGHVDIVTKLLSNSYKGKYNIDATNNNKMTALHLALQKALIEGEERGKTFYNIAELLIDAGAKQDHSEYGIAPVFLLNKVREKYHVSEKLKVLFRGMNSLPHLIEGDDIEQQDLEGFYVNLQVVLDTKWKNHQYEIQTQKNNYLERQGYEYIEGKKLKIDLENIFSSMREGFDWFDRADKILLLGGAGIGKTTLMDYISYSWAKGELFQAQFDYVFRLKLRSLTYQSWHKYSKDTIYGEELAYFVHYCLKEGYGSSDISVEEIKEIINTKIDQVLFLADGYDEIAHLNKKGHVVNTIVNQISQAKNFVMSSRPNAVDSSLKNKFDRIIENTGLDDIGIEQFISKQFRNRNKLGDSLREFLGQYPIVKEMSKFPINLSIICLIWKDETSRKAISGNSLLSQLYNEMVLWIGRRYLSKFKNIDVENYTIKDLSSIPELQALEEIAYEGFKRSKISLDLDKDLIQEIIFTYFPGEVAVDHIKDIHKIGLLKADTDNKRVIDSRHEFIHLSFQEYLVAQYLRRNLGSKDTQVRSKAKDFIVQYKYNPKFLNTMRFLSGLCSSDSSKNGQSIEEQFWRIVMLPQEGTIEIGNILLIRLSMELFAHSSFINQEVSSKKALLEYLESAISKSPGDYLELYRKSSYPSNLFNPIINLLKDTSADLYDRVAAARLLGEIGDIRAVRALETVISESSFFEILPWYDCGYLRIVSVDALQKIGGGNVNTFVKRYLINNFKANKFNNLESTDAIKILSKIADEDIKQYFLEALKDMSVNTQIKGEVLEALFDMQIINNKQLEDMLKNSSESEHLRRLAAELIGEIGGNESFQILEITLENNSDQDWVAATVQPLITIDEKAAVSVLTKLFHNESVNEWVKHTAAKKLVEIGREDKFLQNHFIELVRDSNLDEFSRQIALLSLYRMKNINSSYILEEVFHESSYFLRLNKIMFGCSSLKEVAAVGLYNLGNKDKDIVHYLKKCFRENLLKSSHVTHSLGELDKISDREDDLEFFLDNCHNIKIIKIITHEKWDYIIESCVEELSSDCLCIIKNGILSSSIAVYFNQYNLYYRDKVYSLKEDECKLVEQLMHQKNLPFRALMDKDSFLPYDAKVIDYLNVIGCNHESELNGKLYDMQFNRDEIEL